MSHKTRYLLMVFSLISVISQPIFAVNSENENNNNENNNSNNNENSENNNENNNENENNNNSNNNENNNNNANQVPLNNIPQNIPPPINEAPIPEVVVEPGDPEAEKNLKEFQDHFDNLLAGHGEAAFQIRSDKCPIYKFPNKPEIAGYLSKGDDVHALAIFGPKMEWMKIGKDQFILKSDTRNLGLKTKKH